VQRARRALDELMRRLAALHPTARLARDRGRLGELEQRLRGRTAVLLETRRRALGAVGGQLQALSPLGVLERGYSLARTPAGHVVTSAADVAPGDEVELLLARGELKCRVQSTRPAEGSE
jgi:exodeoxyribonuclease VII large subunit